MKYEIYGRKNNSYVPVDEAETYLVGRVDQVRKSIVVTVFLVK
jgi:hypothetical protein